MNIYRISILLFAFVFIGCQTAVVSVKPRPKNVLLLIGDGMGPAQTEFLSLFAKHAKKGPYKGKKSNWEQLLEKSNLGEMNVEPLNRLVVDSAASATQLASGVRTKSEVIGLGPDYKPVQTILEFAKQRGMATGLVSDTRITHATPAAFAAHVDSRYKENEIATSILESQPDVMLSAGLRHFLPSDTNNKESTAYQRYNELLPEYISRSSKRNDNIDLIEKARSSGYEMVFSKKMLDKSITEKVFGLFDNSAMPDAFLEGKNKEIPTTIEMTRSALKKLSKNKKGFFLMVEAGQIDWAGHGNDAGWLLKEMIRFDNLLKFIHKWVEDNGETLLIVTADHETGSFGFSYSNVLQNRYENNDVQPKFNYGYHAQLDKLYYQKEPIKNAYIKYYNGELKPKTPERLRQEIVRNTGTHFSIQNAKDTLESFVVINSTFPKFKDFGSFYPFGEEQRPALVSRAVADQYNVVWGTGAHSHKPVQLVTYGPQSHRFRGRLHSTQVGKLIMEIIK